MTPGSRFIAAWLLLAAFALAQSSRPATAPASAPVPAGGGLFWFKGNTHTHSWWSDGDSPPERVSGWYKDHGYHFLALSDHDRLAEGERWYVPNSESKLQAAADYEREFGADWVIKRGEGEYAEYRLRTLREYRQLYRESNRFLLIQGEEISADFEGNPVHVNGINLIDVIPPQRGGTVAETIRNNVDAVLAQSARYRQPMLAHVCHPNFRWAMTPDDLVQVKGACLFEVFNGHPDVHNDGDENHPSTDRIWDIMLTRRLAELRLPIIYGVATDDAHCYTRWGVGSANPGRGWVMVRASQLTPGRIVHAMQQGDFYASTGVVLKDVRVDRDTMSLEIDVRPGVRYTTQFIGTLKGYDPNPGHQYRDARGFVYNKYSQSIGQVLAESVGSRASYRFSGKEIYVRAKVTSTARIANPCQEDDVETAWMQPAVPGLSPSEP